MSTPSSSSNSKTQVALILGIPVVVVLFSSLIFFLARNGVINLGTVNHGTLIQPPVQLGDLQPRRLDGGEFLFNQPESKWVFMVVGGRDCTGACERMLYLTRQTHTALGKKVRQVERLYLATEGPVSAPLRDFIEAEHSDLTIVNVDGAEFAEAFAHLKVNPLDKQTFYVVDPLGWVMMRYRAGNTDQDALNALGKDILKDMKRLVR
ncbi:hypothetical protein I6N98_00275 [Spongiibacter nanhainus]|uniref:Cytochrome oxidase Cu insertion factor (SCO1/SenC/PrrC family) n=1 Tax=Spongiibacter nanhainus TaxID=2794344 RepID=A0A7T4URG7_9GAMM|nr:hypothetical protein [Spongiibacter nanhainus]QQD18350.1 hypothetical protein I6N98_00275 [Spongiibacter nanhainus]